MRSASSTTFRVALLGLALAASSGAQSLTETAAPAAEAGDQGPALQRCEAGLVQTLRKLRGAEAEEVQFAPSQRVVTPSDGGVVGVKGAGRYRGRGSGAAHEFSFSCSYDVETGLASGVVLREARSDTARSEAAWQPDLSRLSPEACESAAAQVLTAKHPRVARIEMETATRRLQPGPDDRILLLGHGAVQRAPGMNAVPFSYACEVDPRNGQVVGMKTSL